MKNLILALALLPTAASAVTVSTPTIRVPTQEEIDKTVAELPYPFPREEKLEDYEHVLLYDASGKGSDASWHEPLWKRQAEVVKEKLVALGVKSDRIRVQPVATKAQIIERLKETAGAKKLYLFGHADTLIISVGEEVLNLADIAGDLKDAKVSAICHYGCCFINGDMNDYKCLQDRLQEGQSMKLYGHRLPSTKDDDSPWDKGNPLQRCEVGKACAKLYDPALEARARSAKMMKLALESLPQGIQTATAIRSLETLAVYEGGRPEKLVAPTPMSFFSQQIDQVKKILQQSPQLIK